MKRHAVIIDTDPGVDDAAAILTALASPEIDLLGLTVVAGNVALPDATANACRIVGLSGRQDVPIYPGAPGPLVRDQIFGKYARIGAFPEALVPSGGRAPSVEHAVDFIVRQTMAAAADDAPLTICAIGPLTNIALALVRHPSVARGIGRIVSMGATFAAPGHRPPWAEFNVHADPHAAAIVYRSGIPLVLMPLDVTTQALFTGEHLDALAKRGGEAGTALYRLLTAFDRSDPTRYGRPGGPIHDAMTIAWLVRPDLFETREAVVDVHAAGSASGLTRADFLATGDRAPNALVATAIDEAGYIAFLTERIASFGNAVAQRSDET